MPTGTLPETYITMMTRLALTCVCALFMLGCAAAESPQAWVVDTQSQWHMALDKNGLLIEDGLASPTSKHAGYLSMLQRFDDKRNAKNLTITQSPNWLNWQPIENLGPANMQDAPVFLSLGPSNYWALGRYGTKGKPKNFVAKPASLKGFEDSQLLTTSWPNQFDAPGGLEQGLGGYHAWQSRDMTNWVHHGPVTPRFAKWVTSAEHANGKTYIFYDFPNDQDPHVFEDDNLFDGKPGKNLGLAFNDPSDGSDAGFIRDLKGNYHVIYEDWSPIKARNRSWDSPLAGHAVSEDGPLGYKLGQPAVDHRTNPTGKFGTYMHPHWVKEDPKRFKTNEVRYEVHEPEQPAYGDWAVIAIGGQYYLFGDYDQAGSHQMSTAWFTSDDINKPFTFCDHIGKGHPDPDIGFAEGRFYLFTQQKTDYVSPGPWVETVEARLGVDTDNDGGIDQWTNWQEVKETYDYTEGFSKQVAKTPATLSAADLPAGYGFQFELRLKDTTENKSKPTIDKVTLSFE